MECVYITKINLKNSDNKVTNKETITKLVFDVIDEINKDLPENRRLEKSLGCVIYGSQDSLDSLELVDFVVLVEQKIEDQLGNTISLTDDKAMSQKISPFRTIDTLVDYITNLLE